MKNSTASTSKTERAQTLLWLAVLFTIAVMPLLVSPAAKNPYRLPKTLFFQSMMSFIGAGVFLVIWFVRAEYARLMRHRVAMIIALAACTWTFIVSMYALQPALASRANATVLGYAILVAATLFLARRDIKLPLIAMFAPAIINAIVTVLQALHLWTPIPLERMPKGRLAAMGLLGNPDYVGAYLMVPAIAAIAAAIAFKEHRRIFLVIAAILVTGIFFTQSVTAVGAFMVAVMSLAIVVPSKRVRVAVAAIVLLVIGAVFAYGPTRTRLLHMREFLRSGQLMEFSSYRPPAVMVALDMFRERPLLGVGPGNYEARYMAYKLRVDERFPQWIRPMNANFGEAHNDHVQLLAEAGLPGYLLYLGALGYIASISFRRRDAQSQHAKFAQVFAFPAVVGFAVVGLAQFPLYLTVVTGTALFACSLALVWSHDEGD